MKKVLVLLLALVMVFSFAACDKEDKTEETGTPKVTDPVKETGADTTDPVKETEAGLKANEDITVAYVSSALTNQVFRDQMTALEAYAEEIGINFVYTAESANSGKITACENYIAMGVDVLMVHVGDAELFRPVMEEAQAAGIKWFSYDTNIEGSDAYYGWKNYDLGYAIGRNAAEWVNANYNEGDELNAISCNYPPFSFLIEREQGYLDAIEELCVAEVEWIADAQAGFVDEGVTAGENFLQLGKDINLIVGINDSGLVGVYEAFDAAGYKPDNLGFFGCDSDPEALKLIADGTIYKGTINTGLVKLAPDFLDICVDLANDTGGGEHWGDFILITDDNVHEFMSEQFAPTHTWVESFSTQVFRKVL